MANPKILIVEDYPELITYYEDELEGKVTVLAATGFAQAEELFSMNPDIKIIVVDHTLDNFNGCILVKKFRETFKGPMIGTGSWHTEFFVDCRCDYNVTWRTDVKNLVLKILNL